MTKKCQRSYIVDQDRKKKKKFDVNDTKRIYDKHLSLLYSPSLVYIVFK